MGVGSSRCPTIISSNVGTPKPPNQLEQPWAGHTNYVNSLSLSPDGRRLASTSLDQTVRFWDAHSGDPIEQPLQHQGGLWVVTFSPSGEFVACGGTDGKISIWRAPWWDASQRESIDLTAKPLTTISGHENYISNIAYLPGGERVVSCSDDKTVRIWNVENGEQEGTSMEHEDRVYGLAVTRDGKRILSGSEDKKIKVFDVESGKLVLGPIKGHKDWIRCVLWSLDGSKLFSASDDRTICCWHSETTEPIGEPWIGHTDYVNSLTLSPDGMILASASSNNTVRFWDARSGDPIKKLLQHQDSLWIVTFSPSGEFVASGNEEISIWRVFGTMMVKNW
ncbi:hypothetical protein PAXINDRAFT_117028 [Paxillus involutus ATCC 200175]|uniref:WD40 repeat-like protein n=1 Tax=Paxillus involutus ATCC 200175 TaxID=664439 RepID=A0A0C9U2D8_PAXIN|nr:hypothetical protein PAXINDRAFT_117028 [Paxillus involutus ATCC 200175]